MKALKKITFYTTMGLSAFVLVAYMYLYKLPKGPDLTELEPLQNGTSRFVINAYQDSVRKTIRIWTHRPQRWFDGDRILFVMHGAGRNADDYLNAWIEFAEETNTLLVVPEFESPFSRVITNDYAEGNLFTYFGSRNPKAEWAFAVIENAFDHITEQNDLSNDSYDIFGHSAGAQFVHRMILLEPEARIRQAIAANAGAYTFPNPEIEFPYGIKNVSLDEDSLRSSLRKKLLILLGELDNTADQGILDLSAAAMEQGPHRLARGSNFFAESETFANRNGLEFNWEFAMVKGVGHNFREMSKHAAAYLR